MKRALAAVALCACAHGESFHPPAGYAVTRAGAVEVCLPPGENAYVKSLRCPDGTAPRAERMGSVGTRGPIGKADEERALLQMDAGRPLAAGEPDLHIVDAFKLSCGARETTLFVDVYHCASGSPRGAPSGFSLQQ